VNAAQIVLFEDEAVSRLEPLTAMRPIFELVAGAFSLRSRVHLVTGRAPGAALVRPELTALLPALGLQDFRKVPGDGPWTFVNGAALLDPAGWQEIARLGMGEGWISPAGRLVAFHCDDVRAVVSLSRGKGSDRDGGLRFHDSDRVRLIGHLWDLIDAHEKLLGGDLATLLGLPGETNFATRVGLSGSLLAHAPAAGHCVAGEAVFVEEGAQLEPPVACDARGGPILVCRGARVKPFSLLEGPLIIGADTIVLGGRVAGSYLGPGCRIGGEVSDSVFLGSTNKAHAGFIGHSYIGEWVNLGALTTTSNLKNTYGEIRCREGEKPEPTGRHKLGSFLGDHVRTGIGTLLECGSVIGLGTQLAAAERPAPKWMPAFVWDAGHGAQEYELQRFLAVAQRVFERRGRMLDDTQRGLIERAHAASTPQRRHYLKETGRERAGKR
jgi:UDP-N-acetylglucosamine diphosphorylase/glucosamine-1-phosphate N-acetyltransferase